MDTKRQDNNPSSNLKSQLNRMLSIIIVLFLGIAFFFFLYRINDVLSVISKIFNILSPIIYGLAFAYILNPVVHFFERKIVHLTSQKLKNETSARKISRSVSIIITLVIVICFIYILCAMIVPEILNSVINAAANMPEQISNIEIFLNNTFQNENNRLLPDLTSIVEKATEVFNNWVQNDFLKSLNSILSGVTTGVIGFGKELLNIVVGIMVSVYVLMSKETFTGQSKKIIYALFKTRNANWIIRTCRKSNAIFSGFIYGKIIDSLIIGILCFICLYIFKFPYAMLVSVIVGVTNIIPFFGPFIGAVPSAILIFLVDPIKGLYFILFILVLQQIDGNIIGPKILGDSTGLSAFWVIFSILVGGGLFGFVGMLLGVPVFAVFYFVIGEVVNSVLKARQLPCNSKDYEKIQQIQEGTNKVIVLPNDYEKENIKKTNKTKS